MSTEHLWLGIGLAGQSLFFARFPVQWIASERRKQSVVPVGFWYFSLVAASSCFCTPQSLLHPPRHPGGGATGAGH